MNWTRLSAGTALVLAGFVLAIGAHAEKSVFGFDPKKQWYDLTTGASLPDTSWRKATDGLGVMLVLTPDADTFFRDWAGMQFTKAPVVETPPRIRRGAVVAAILTYSGCGTGPQGCQAIAKFNIQQPDGSSYGEVPEIKISDGRVSSPGVIYLSRAGPSLHMEPTDQLGRYIVSVTVSDPNRGRTINLQQAFELVP